MHIGLRVKYRLFLSDIIETWIFWTDFRKNDLVTNFTKIRPFVAELFHPDVRVNRDIYDESDSLFSLFWGKRRNERIVTEYVQVIGLKVLLKTQMTDQLS